METLAAFVAGAVVGGAGIVLFLRRRQPDSNDTTSVLEDTQHDLNVLTMQANRLFDDAIRRAREA